MKNLIVIVSFALVLFACTDSKNYKNDEEVNQKNDLDSINEEFVILEEDYLTVWDDKDNVDSPAIWVKDDSTAWVISTMKSTHGLIIHNAISGEEIQRVGSEGNGMIEFDRPNGIWVIDDLCFVTERNNKRVQVLRLPNLEFVGFFGEDKFQNVYGITVQKMNDYYDVYITDNYETSDEEIPADSLLGKRVLNYKVKANNTVEAEFVRYIGDTSEEGALRIVESIFIDPENNALLIAEEDERNTHIKVYDLKTGKYKGIDMGKDIFKNQAEGIALYDCGNGEGYWISTDQGKGGNAFHFFDRKSYEYVGSFRSKETQNTDGIWFTQRALQNFPNGVLIAVNNDGGLGAFSWAKITEALDLFCE